MDEEIAVPLAWVDADETPVYFANQFLFQLVSDTEFALSIGQAIPAALLGTPEERKDQLSRITYVPVHTLARISLTRQRVEELVGVLQTVLEATSKQAPPT